MKQISHIDELPKDFLGCCIIDFAPVEQDVLLMAIHRHPNYCGWLLFVIQSSFLSEVLTDGIWALSTWQSMQEAFLKRKTGFPLTGKNRFMEWLWLAPHRRVSPIKRLNNQSIYTYPVLECYHQHIDDPQPFFHELEKKALLDKDKLLDKIRLCSTCQSSLLNYIETCPHCHSIDVIERVSLHCFTCGYVENESLFTRKGKLECPKCFTQMRHIGVDYDRPLETFFCNACDSTFIEANTMVRCFNCDSLSSISSLLVNKIFTYKLGYLSEYYLRNESVILAPSLDFDEIIAPHYFSSILPWLNKIAIQHKQEHYVMALQLNSVKENPIEESNGTLMILVEELSKNVCRMIKDTDICCHYRTDLILVFINMPIKDDMQLIENKVKTLSEKIKEDSFFIEVYYFSLPDPSLINTDIWLDCKLSSEHYE
ncbi:hypothetical protein [uncultured Shewanella sp.]|uniref:TackOD1 domain-containing metal-binding protein n=1 Tax=uncultured Shewanella sp. TaxID=173975 RepID=UPI00261091B1|nr:hypothetical protein [uncultured Shewanella sp.]